MTHSSESISVKHNMQTIAFYNCENLFDVYNDKRINDDDFLPNSVKKWTYPRYENKLRKLSFAISNIGHDETGKHPALVGLAEVENAKVVKDLIQHPHLEDCHYNYVHFNSLDERGIDVALIYDRTAFEVTHSETFSIDLTDDDGGLDFTRDILLVSGLLDAELIHVIVNHWSSRREGEKESEPKRIIASNKVSEIIQSLRSDETDPRIIVMGDFNDEPFNTSIRTMVDTNSLYNPMATLRSFSRGSVYHDRKWNLFDQIMLTTNFFKSSKNQFEFFKANIFDVDFLKLFRGKYKGSPFRTYVGKKYVGGYSDHFPVYAILKK
ncbi:endonuclease [Flavobacteriaceae bacterium XHP0103]|uniref:endonuclease/exonuclease/phosphatase family protein n=1 Tax=Marixanthotalea marina TaxID=2844359 RepID=UPI002989B32C|nr:endonuclease [Marixanthotalea marina]MBU3820843.1 endonuclease [Marixanthotalea marina]